MTLEEPPLLPELLFPLKPGEKYYLSHQLGGLLTNKTAPNNIKRMANMQQFFSSLGESTSPPKGEAERGGLQALPMACRQFRAWLHQLPSCFSRPSCQLPFKLCTHSIFKASKSSCNYQTIGNKPRGYLTYTQACPHVTIQGFMLTKLSPEQ